MKYNVLVCTVLMFNVACATHHVVIDKSGTYAFRGNVIGNPTSPDESAIEVTVGNVEIDLGGYAVLQMPGNTQTGFKGIQVNDNLSQVSIKNGIVQNVTGEGILVQDGCKNVHIEEMLFKVCDNGGIYLDGLSSGTGIGNCLIEDCVVLSCTGAEGGPARGLYMSSCNNVIVRDSFFNDNDAQMTSSGFGVECVDCNLCKFADCTLASNGGFELSGGFSFTNCFDFFMDYCGVGQSIGRSSAATSFTAGFYMDQCNNIVFTGCESVSNIHTQQKAVGFYCNDSTGLIFQECLAESQMGETGACGFELKEQLCASLSRCSSKLNKTVSSGTAYGILLTGTLNNNCSVTECQVEHTKGVGASFGVVDQRNPSTSLFMRNQAFNNGTNYDVTYPVGISLPLIQGSLSNILTGLPTLRAGDLDNLDIDP